MMVKEAGMKKSEFLRMLSLAVKECQRLPGIDNTPTWRAIEQVCAKVGFVVNSSPKAKAEDNKLFRAIRDLSRVGTYPLDTLHSIKISEIVEEAWESYQNQIQNKLGV